MDYTEDFRPEYTRVVNKYLRTLNDRQPKKALQVRHICTMMLKDTWFYIEKNVLLNEREFITVSDLCYHFHMSSLYN